MATSQPPSRRIDELLRWAAQQLAAGESPAVDARVLLAAALDRDLTYLMTWPERELDDPQCEQFRAWVAQRAKGRPVAHLVGYRDFWTLRLQVNDATLIPRPETELLVEAALDLPLPDNARVADLGTGTGAIALALASEHPKWSVTACDRVVDAVKLAQQNASANALTNVTCVHSHWFDALNGQVFDLIVSNPPYIETDSEYLTQGDVRFEPASALTSGSDGLDDIRTIAEQARNHLVSRGWLVLEHGHAQHHAINTLLCEKGFTDVRTLSDLNNLPRVTLARKSH